MTSTNLFKSIMNRFLNKKKGGDDPLSPPQSSKKWRKVKKVSPEQRPKLDLIGALPPTDDFRTSLIMPTLSTRFSMLREQDDPSTKMGKASDDSVLQPRRQSRMLDFGFTSNDLNDISEVASINSSIRPPFAVPRQDSYNSEEGDGTDNDSSMNGSVMSRSRPGEGNVLFGGRQKVYKVATGSAMSTGGASERTLGKVYYGDDVSMSAFQKYRQQQQRDGADSASIFSDSQDTQIRMSSGDEASPTRNSDDPAGGIGLGLTHPEAIISAPVNRSSNSTTASTPSQERVSSAATSVASQYIGTAVTTPAAHAVSASPPKAPTLERSLTKRRLYEQGLEKSMHDQQASTLTRLKSIQRQRSPTVGSIASVPSLSHSKSISHMQDRAFQPYALQSSSQSAINAFPPVASLRQLSSSNTSPTASFPHSPLSPTMSDSETLHSALEPSDRGKATALGAFNKPKNQYDEQQYMQRQAQLHQSNQVGPPRKNSVPDANLARFDSPRQTNESRDAQRSRSQSVSSKNEQSPNMAFSVFQNAAVQNRMVHGENPNLPPAAPLPPAPTSTDTHRTFFGDISASDDEEEDIVSDFERSGLHSAPNSYMPTGGNGRFMPGSLTSVSEHPALRHETPNIPEVDEVEEESKLSIQPMQPPYIADVTPPNTSDGRSDMDSPTIGNTHSLGGLIQHLRNTSDQSSIYAAVPSSSDVPGLYNEITSAPSQTRGISQSEHNQDSTYSGSNPWDLGELETYYGDIIADRPTSQRDPAAGRGQPLGLALSKANISSRPSTRDSDIIDGALWQDDFKKHTRDASTATQVERRAFDDELAARQRAIQQKMKSIVESESRGTSPAPSAGGALKAFGMLKAKQSHETISRDGSSRALKMLGVGAQGSKQDKYSIYEDPQANNSRVVTPGNAWAPPSAGSQWPLPGPKEQKIGGTVQAARSRIEGAMGGRDVGGVSSRNPPQRPASRERSRTRSGSVASRTRSRSRNGGAREELNAAPEVPQMPVARPSDETLRSRTPLSTDGYGRMRSNSKPGSYFDSRTLHPVHNGAPAGRMTTGGDSPASMSSTGYPSSMPTARPSYSTTNSSATMKSASSAMTMPHVPTVRAAGSLLRKKTINKADISEPTLISSTSNVDTVDLPTARTLAQPPLVPMTNSRRRVFTDVNGGEVTKSVFSPPMPQHAATFAGLPADGWSEATQPQRGFPRTARSQESIDARATRFDAIGSPVMNEAGMF